MKIVSRVEGPLLHVEVSGEEVLDGRGARLLQEEVLERLERGALLVLSLGALRDVDSAGIGALISILKAVRGHGGRMALVEVPARIQSVLQITRLSCIFEIYPDEKAALAALAAVPV